MFYEKKREDHAEGNEDSGEQQINFAWIVFVGMQIGYREREIKHMTFGKWSDLFAEFRKMHNATMKRAVFEERKTVSLMDL